MGGESDKVRRTSLPLRRRGPYIRKSHRYGTAPSAREIKECGRGDEEETMG